MTTLIADYVNERATFESFLRSDCPERILLLEGESGSGKTTLITFFQENLPPTITHVPIQLRGSAVTVAEVFFRSGRMLSWGQLPNFTAQVADLQNAPVVKVDRNWLAGIGNKIDVALKVQNLVDREQRIAALTESWFSDLSEFDYPVLLLFDTFEQATAEVKDWISGPLLARAACTNQVRVLVAGQKIPDKHNIEWGQCCIHHQLYGVPEARHWLPVVEALHRRIPFDDPLAWLAGVCHALKGNPDNIKKIIEALPILELQA